MKAIKDTLGVFAAIGMLAALPMAAIAQGTGSPTPAASSPATSGVLVTGTLTATDYGFSDDTSVETGQRQRNRLYTGHVEMDDARLSGDVIGTDNADRYCVRECNPDTFRADLLWGTIQITNDGGTWAGTSVGTSDKTADGRGVTHYQLAGTGAYEGLSAVIFETEVASGDKVWNGVIFPGGLPPERSPSSVPTESSASAAPGASVLPGLTLVGLGDSIPGALDCPPGCRSYVEVYGDLASQALGVPVRVLNLATNDQMDSTGLLSRVQDDHAYRSALAGADLITLTIGNNDESGIWGCSSDDACVAARAATRQNIDTILHEIASLRGGRPTAIRVTDYYDMSIDPQLRAADKLAAFDAMICDVAEANGAVCVDLVPAFNGPDGSADAGDLLLGDHIHASKAGQDLIAKTIAAAGYAPLR